MEIELLIILIRQFAIFDNIGENVTHLDHDIHEANIFSHIYISNLSSSWCL